MLHQQLTPDGTTNFPDLKEPVLFIIPNPFDDYLRKKKGWFAKVRKIEMQLKSTRERLEQLVKKNQATQQELQSIKAYCTTLPKGRVFKLSKEDS